MAVDLDLTVQHASQGYYADFRVHVAGSAAPIAPLPAPITITFDLAHLRALTLDPRAYGAVLTSMLFASAEPRVAFAQARAVAVQHSAPLRLRLTLPPTAEELHTLHWETLADPEAPDQPLATSAQILFSRTLPSSDWQPVSVRTGGALRAVALVASPADLSDYGLATLDAAQGVAQVHSHLSGCALTVLGQETRASLPNLIQHLHRGCDLLLLVAHGRVDEQGQTWLYLEDEGGHTAPVAGAELVARIDVLSDKPKLVILGSCESAGDGSGPVLAALGPQLVRAGVPAVLAMQGRVTLETLERFLPACLQALLQDGQIDRAVAIARDLIRERPDWWVPALWMRATDGRLWAEPVRPAAPPNAALHQLRPPLTDFVGRQAEIAHLIAVLRRAQIEEGRIAAICGVRGMGGLGKTTLAEYVAHQLRPLFPDAQLVLNLRGATPEPLAPAQALQQLVRAFVPEEKLPDDLPVLQARYRSLLDGRRALILADDAKDAAQVRPLLPPAGCALLITSRQRFALDGMAALDLARLNEAEAIQLLQGICPRVNEDQARQIARLCGYLPLALRVSAGILLNDEALLVERYVTQLADERQRLVHLRDPDDPERDVAATLGLSYAALDQLTQAAFRRLGVLAANADLRLIAAVLDQSEEHTEVVLRLLHRRSLLEYDTAHQRWGLHDLVRVFALERLMEANEEPTVRLRYTEHVIRIIHEADQHYEAGGDGVLVGLSLFDRERAHLDTVRVWLWAQPRTVSTDTLLITEAQATHYIGRVRDPLRTVQVPHYEHAAAAAQRQGNRQAQGQFLGNLGTVSLNLGESRTAISYYQQCLSIAREVGDRRGEGRALGNIGMAYLNLGEIRSAIHYLEQDIVIAHEIGDRRGEGNALANLGNAHYELKHFAEALTCCQAGLVLAQEIGERRLEAEVLRYLANIQDVLGQWTKAEANYQASLTIADTIGNAGEGSRTRWVYGQFLIRQGERERGLSLMQECLDYEQRIGHTETDDDAALVAHLQAGGALPFAVPYAAFTPLRHAIVAIAQGNTRFLSDAEAALVQWERRCYHLTAPVRSIWAGQRDPDVLTMDLSTIDAALIQQVLEDLGGERWDKPSVV